MIQNLSQFIRHPQSRSIGVVFAVLSIAFGSWVARIPEIQNRFELSEAMLGLALLGGSMGGLLVMPFAAWLIQRLQAGRASFYYGIALCLFMLLPVNAFSFFTLFLGLFSLGLFINVLDVAINTTASTIETQTDRHILSTCHGLFSLGGMLGAATSALTASWSISINQHFGGLSAFLILILFIIRRPLFSIESVTHESTLESETEVAPLFSLPRGSVLPIALIGFIIMMGEGAVADWSAVYLQNTLGSSVFIAGLGFAGFSFAMALGRFLGDSLIPKWGAKSIVQYGSLIGAVGLLITISIPNTTIAIIGFTLVGIGFSCVVPILFSTAAKLEDVPSEAAIASVTASGVVGFLVGPPLIGGIAETFDLAFGFGFIALFAFIAFLLSRKAKL